MTKEKVRAVRVWSVGPDRVDDGGKNILGMKDDISAVMTIRP